MRADMFKVIVERPRSGSRMRWSSADRRYLNSEEAPPKLGIRRGHLRSKWLNEHLGPLRKFLARRAGRPWDVVYSEICAVIANRSTVKQHVLSHIPDLVAIDTKLVDGQVYGPTWRTPFTPLRDLTQGLYVDPLTGVLRRNDQRVTSGQRRREHEKRKQAELDARRRTLSPTEQLHRVDGVWYYVRLARLPEGRKEARIVDGQRRETIVYDKRWDMLLKAAVSSKDRTTSGDLYGRPGLHAVAKRQLGFHELRRYGLN